MPSFSARTVNYKRALLLADQVGQYYLDLQDKRTVSALWRWCTSAFSTNTFPTWDLAHPFRYIAHNGEINTVRGNVNWFKAREQAISSPILGDDLKKLAAALSRPVRLRPSTMRSNCWSWAVAIRWPRLSC